MSSNITITNGTKYFSRQLLAMACQAELLGWWYHLRWIIYRFRIQRWPIIVILTTFICCNSIIYSFNIHSFAASILFVLLTGQFYVPFKCLFTILWLDILKVKITHGLAHGSVWDLVGILLLLFQSRLLFMELLL